MGCCLSSSPLEAHEEKEQDKFENYVINSYKRAIRPRCLFYIAIGPFANWENENSESITRKMLLGIFIPWRIIFIALALLYASMTTPHNVRGVVGLALTLASEIITYSYIGITKRCGATLFHLWATVGTALAIISSPHDIIFAANSTIASMVFLLSLSAEFSAWLYRVIYGCFLGIVLFQEILLQQEHIRGAFTSDEELFDVHFIRAQLFIITSYMVFLAVYMADIFLCRSASGVQEAATFADQCCKLLSTFDTKEAVDLLQKVGRSKTRLPDNLWESFKSLVEDLHLYRAYLPQHVLVSRRSALEVADEINFASSLSNNSTNTRSTTVEMNAVVLTLQAQEFMDFEEATVFMEAAAAIISAFKGTVELTSPSAMAASFSKAPLKRITKKPSRSSIARRQEASKKPEPDPVWEMVAAEAGRATLDYLQDLGIINVTAVVTSGQLRRTVVADGASSSHVVAHGATIQEGLQLAQIRNKRTLMRVLMSEAAALAVCEMVLPTLQVQQHKGVKCLLFEYFSMPAVEEDAHRLAIREVFVLIVNGRLDSALAGISEAYAAESLACRRWRQMLYKIIWSPQPGTWSLRLPILFSGGWVPLGIPSEQVIATFQLEPHGRASVTDKSLIPSPRPQLSFPQHVETFDSVANLEMAISQRQRAIVVADDDALFPVFVHEDDSDMDHSPASSPNQSQPSGINEDKLETGNSAPQQHKRIVTDTSGSTWNITKRILGGGAFATVWLATNDKGRPVAAKIIDTSHRNISSSAHEIILEVESLASLRHPNIVSYLSWAMVGKDMYVFMEWVSGGSLRQLLDQCGSIPVDIARGYTLDAIEGLRFLHSKGMVHCDVKPHNLLLEANGSLKIADFGSVVSCMDREDRPVVQKRFLDPNSSNEMEAAHPVDHEDLDVKGTAWYMSPEACRGDVLAASDVWSLGITVAELICGQLPFSAQDLSTSQSRFIQRIGSGEIIPSTSHVPVLHDLVSAHPALGEFLRICWEYDPSRRPHTHNICERLSWLTSQKGFH